MKKLIHTIDIPKFSHQEFGTGKNEERLYPCKVFVGPKGKAILITKKKVIKVKPGAI